MAEIAMAAVRVPIESYSSLMKNLANNPNAVVVLPALFELGMVVATAGVLRFADDNNLDLVHLLARHAAGDWGDLPDLDYRSNEDALRTGARLLSSYSVTQDAKVWIITDAETTACGPCWTGRGDCPGGGHFEGGAHFVEGPPHRLTTTILLPQDY